MNEFSHMGDEIEFAAKVIEWLRSAPELGRSYGEFYVKRVVVCLAGDELGQFEPDVNGEMWLYSNMPKDGETA